MQDSGGTVDFITRLYFLHDFSSKFEKMVPKKQGQRVKQLTKGTALALAYT